MVRRPLPTTNDKIRKIMKARHIIPVVHNYHRPEDYDTYENTYQVIPVRNKKITFKKQEEDDNE